MWKTCKTTAVMELTLQEIWARACADMEVSMSGATFKLWISPCFIKSISEIDSERIIVEVGTPSTYHVRQVDERYYGQIKQALEKQLEKKVELALVVGSKPQLSTENRVETRIETQIDQGLFSNQVIKNEPVSAPSLYSKYTFDSYVVGSSNSLAYAAAKAVVEYPGSRHNPLFIWGGVGVGKTHLMQAVGQALYSKGNKKVVYITSEQFTNDLVNSLKSKTIDSFKKKYREVGALLIDDVQFFAGKEASQEEFFHTFNELYLKGIQIVMTSDRKPQDIEKLEERLVSRFLGGLTVDVGLPDYEMRVAILTNKAESLKANISRASINTIAENITTNSRELEGILVRIVNEASLNGGVVSDEVVERVAGVKSKRIEKKVRPIQLISAVAKHFDFKNKDIVGKSRRADLVLARHIAIYLLRGELGLQLTKVGELMGGRDHTTIMHAEDKIKQEIDVNNSIRNHIVALKQEIYL